MIHRIHPAITIEELRTPELEHLREGVALCSPRVSRKYSAIRREESSFPVTLCN
jgi:hypothetical protein